jgi:Sulfotransferase domain
MPVDLRRSSLQANRTTWVVSLGHVAQPRGPGPHVALIGAARSGTTYLAAQLASHPAIDPGVIKEPNYFSREFDRGRDWYDSLYQPAAEGLLWLDASTSVTVPQFPHALDRLRDASPGAFVVYVVREPVERAVSHYLYLRHYFRAEDAATFGAGLATNPLYLGTSDYAHWLSRITGNFPPEQVLVVPFGLLKGNDPVVATVAFEQLGLDAMEIPESAIEHRNDVVAFKHQIYRSAYRRIRATRLYPWARRHLGRDRTRRIRAAVTRQTALPTREEALATCTAEQRDELTALERRGRDAVRHYLVDQDRRIGLQWLSAWQPGLSD